MIDGAVANRPVRCSAEFAIVGAHIMRPPVLCQTTPALRATPPRRGILAMSRKWVHTAATTHGERPYTRTVNGYYEDGAFYIIAHAGQRRSAGFE